jgi:CubicO group peptidase (beta-lactamase class C family)
MTTPTPLPRSAPEAAGLPASAILKFIAAAEKHIDALHSLMLLRHGCVAAEGWWAPYAAGRPHLLFSLSKSFTSTAVGLAVAEGRLTVDDPVLSFFPNETPGRPSRNLADMRVRHLLSMSTGHAEDTTGFMVRRRDGDWARGFLSRPVKHQPGTHFVYNSGATYMLSAIVQRLTGMSLLDYLTPRLFEPLGIQGAAWESCPRGVNTGGWGLSVKTEDIARFGQLYLQKGEWEGRRLLPEAWVAEATSAQAPFSAGGGNDWQQGYGYQFWRCQHGAYRGDGAFGQYCIVMPDQDAVLAITAGVKDMQAVLDLVWKHLLPAMQPGALPADAAAQDKLAGKLSSLALPPQRGRRSSPMAPRVSGAVYAFPANEQGLRSASLEFGKDGCTLAVTDRLGEHRIACGYGAWVTGTTAYGSQPMHGGAPKPQAVAASGAWTADDTFTIRACLCETPFIPALSFRFAGRRLFYSMEANVSFGPTQLPKLIGRCS